MMSGRFLMASEAAPVLAYANVGPRDTLPIDGLTVTYNGKVYWILELETKFPNPTRTSPDGWHVVYGPSQEEIDVNKKPSGDPVDFLGLDKLWAQLTSIAKVVVIVLILLIVLQVAGVIRDTGLLKNVRG